MVANYPLSLNMVAGSIASSMYPETISAISLNCFEVADPSTGKSFFLSKIIQASAVSDSAISRFIHCPTSLSVL